MWAVTVIDACPIVFLEEPQIGARPSREGGVSVPKVVDAKSGPPDLQNYLPPPHGALPILETEP